VVNDFEPDDPVLLPSGETARVVGENSEGVCVRYDGALSEQSAYVTLPAKLLRRYVPGLRLPAPVRVVRGESGVVRIIAAAKAG
jgi:hypothetical protein